MFTDLVFDLHDVGVRFGATKVLTGVRLAIRAGERVAVIGPSGAGKSTLIGLLNGTVTATQGSVRALDCPYGEATARRVRAAQQKIGTIHQQFDLVGELRTVHNVNAGRLGAWPFWKAALSLLLPRDVQPVRAALDRVGIGDKYNSRTGDLSGGEQQRVAIARVLVQRPQVILADEPVASLDPARGLEIVNLLLDLSVETGTTFVASLHDVEMALGRFERVVGLREGQIAFDKSAAELTENEIADLYLLERAEEPA